MNDLGIAYLDLGRYKKAQQLFLTRVQTTRRVLGEQQAYLAMTNLGQAYERQGRYDEAEALCVEVLEVQRRVLGEKHPDTLESIRNLIGLYEAWGKPQQAEEWRAKLPRKEGTEE